MVNICLVMIVKNEAKIIKRCIDSCLGIIDAISICDTGSTDETVKLIDEYGLKIPTRIEKHEWKNFGHNRTLSYDTAKKFVKELKWNLKESYALLLDADMCLCKDDSFDKNKLTEVGYLLIQKSSIEYYNIRLIRFDIDLKCVGYTHEYWDYPITHRLADLWIQDLDDGGSKSGKFQRDEKLLLKALEENPNDPRTLFYLAETYRNLNKYDKAIQYYEARIKRGGWVEEIYMSIYQIAECYKNLKMYNEFATWSFKAYDFLPARVDSLNSLATYYRLTNKFLPCYHLSRICAETKYPDDHLLFINPRAYNQDPYFNMAVSAYYINQKNAGFHITEMAMRKFGEYHLYNGIMTFYIQPIKISKIISLTSYIQGYHPMNPSIIKTDTGYIINLRHVNYTVSPILKYSYTDYIHTRNVLLFFDTNLYLENVHELKDNFEHTGLVRGFEDVRLYGSPGDLHAIATSCLETGTPNIYHLKINNFKITDIKRLIYPKAENSNQCEKNWLPINSTDTYVDLIYKYDPLILLRYDYSTSKINILSSEETDYYFDTFRGSACCPFEDGYLVITHEVYNKEIEHDGKRGMTRLYFHRFMIIDDKYMIRKSSYPFYLFKQGVEYVCGVAHGHNGKIIITMGEDDHKAYIVEVEVETVRRLMFLVVDDN